MELPVWSSTFVAPTTSPMRLFVYVLLSVIVSTLKMAVMAFRSIHGLPPSYLQLFVPYQLDVLGCAQHNRIV